MDVEAVEACATAELDADLVLIGKRTQAAWVVAAGDYESWLQIWKHGVMEVVGVDERDSQLFGGFVAMKKHDLSQALGFVHGVSKLSIHLPSCEQTGEVQVKQDVLEDFDGVQRSMMGKSMVAAMQLIEVHRW